MAQEKGVGNTSVLILKLLEEKDMYGYEMIETLAARSDDTFRLKAGTLYPILHGLEKDGFVTSYEEAAEGRTRKYYRLTEAGKGELAKQTERWNAYAAAVHKVLNGGACCAGV